MGENIQYCLDTNIVSDFLRNRDDVVQYLHDATVNGCGIYIPSIVYYEITRGYLATQSWHRLSGFTTFFQSLKRLPLEMGNLKVLDQAAKIYDELHRGKQIEDNDIYIAALAMVNGCILVTDNWKHFGRITGLKLTNWRNANMT
ncbi:MAG: PIN domain-containing protein [Selenomonadaceae bacterium]|nr:PIN domain-containing protein [Selenomonadaceae bacterium]